MSLSHNMERALRLHALTLQKRARDLQEQIDELTVPLRMQIEAIEAQFDGIAALLTEGQKVKDEMVVCGWCGTLLEEQHAQIDEDGNATCIHDPDMDQSLHCRDPARSWVGEDTIMAAEPGDGSVAGSL